MKNKKCPNLYYFLICPNSTANQVASNRRNLLLSSSGGQKLEIRCRLGPSLEALGRTLCLLPASGCQAVLGVPQLVVASLQPPLSSSSRGLLPAHLRFKYHDLGRLRKWCDYDFHEPNNKIKLYGLSNPWEQVTVEDRNWSKLGSFNLWDRSCGSKWNLGLIKWQKNNWTFEYTDIFTLV